MSTPKRTSQSGSKRSTLPRYVRWSLPLIAVCVLAVSVVVLAQGNTYGLRRSVFSNGGARSEGSQYRINYSVGQPSTVGDSRGQNYRMGQGYWHAAPSPTPTPTPTPGPTCPPIAPINPDCEQERINGYQPGRFETIRPLLDAAASNSLPPPATVYPTIRAGQPPADTEISPSQPIPSLVLRGIAWQESRWKQFADHKDSDPDETNFCTLMSEYLAAGDCGYGLMMVTDCMKKYDGCSWPTPELIAGNLVHNLSRGVYILLQKWNCRQDIGDPDCAPSTLIGNNDPTVPEVWYYASGAYHNWDAASNPNNVAYSVWRPPYYNDEPVGQRLDHPYQELVWGWIAHPEDAHPSPIPPDWQQLWNSVRWAWVPRGVWGLPGEDWRPWGWAAKPILHILPAIHVESKVGDIKVGPTIMLRNTTSSIQAADIVLYDNNDEFSRWWLGVPYDPVNPITPNPPIRLAAHETRPVIVAAAFLDEEVFSGYALVSANEGVEVWIMYQNKTFLPVVFKGYSGYINAAAGNSSPPADAIRNGGFEMFEGGRPSSWQVFSSLGSPLADSTWFRSGHYGAHLGGYDDPAGNGDVDDRLEQDGISIPDCPAVRLTFSWSMKGKETSGHDNLRVFLRTGDTKVEVYAINSSWQKRTWQQVSIPLDSFRGQTVSLMFEADMNDSLPTNFFLDNVAVGTCGDR